MRTFAVSNIEKSFLYLHQKTNCCIYSSGKFAVTKLDLIAYYFNISALYKYLRSLHFENTSCICIWGKLLHLQSMNYNCSWGKSTLEDVGFCYFYTLSNFYIHVSTVKTNGFQIFEIVLIFYFILPEQLFVWLEFQRGPYLWEHLL